MKTVLLIDDDEDEYIILCDVLENMGLPIICHHLKDSTRAVDAIIKYRPDFIFVDLNMPILHGIDCIKMIYNSKIPYKSPVVIYSTSITQEVKEIAKNFAVVAFIQKCNSEKELKEELLKFFSTKTDF